MIRGPPIVIGQALDATELVKINKRRRPALKRVSGESPDSNGRGGNQTVAG